MSWRESLYQMQLLVTQPQLLLWLLLVAVLACSFLVLALVLQASRHARLLRQMTPSALGGVGEAGAILEEGIEAVASAAAEQLSVPQSDRIIPVGTRGFAILVVSLAAGVWLLGLALAPDRQAFLASAEWRFQPLYIAVHLVTLRVFVAVFTKSFRHGIAHLDADPEKATAGFRLILGPLGAALALLIALPFCVLDYRYLVGEYKRLGSTEHLSGIDILMWLIWCAEWIINAFIWVVLVGFLAKNAVTIRSHKFRAPIETVLHEKHYRPFLHMSTQGAGIVLAFSIVTALYIYFTDGALSDYMGLFVTGLLIVIGFVVPWLLLRAKVRAAVQEQTESLGSRLALADGRPAGDNDMASLSRRLDEVVALLRITHLERMRLNLGWTEAKAVLVRLMAPAVTIAWHYGHSLAGIVQKATLGAQGLLGVFRLPF